MKETNILFIYSFMQTNGWFIAELLFISAIVIIEVKKKMLFPIYVQIGLLFLLSFLLQVYGLIVVEMILILVLLNFKRHAKDKVPVYVFLGIITLIFSTISLIARDYLLAGKSAELSFILFTVAAILSFNLQLKYEN